MKVKENHRRMAIVSEALEILGTATSTEIAYKTNMSKLNVQKTLSELQRKLYVTKGERTGTGNQAVWTNLKQYKFSTQNQIDWNFYHKIFCDLVRSSYDQV